MKRYIEKMIQEKASLILTQYQSRLKRSHYPSSTEQPTKKYRMLEKKVAAVEHLAEKSSPVGNMAIPAKFPITEISYTGIKVVIGFVFYVLTEKHLRSMVQVVGYRTHDVKVLGLSPNNGLNLKVAVTL